MRASRSDTRVASQAFERMHNTLSHRSKTYAPGGTICFIRVAWTKRTREKSWLSRKRGTLRLASAMRGMRAGVARAWQVQPLSARLRALAYR